MIAPASRCAAAVVLCIGLGFTVAAQTPRAPAISQDDLRTWLTYLASDELQGRQAYTEGLGLAGAYIARHLQEWGVKPGGDRGSYFQEVRVLGVRTRSNSSVTVTVNGQTRTFKDGEGVTFPRNQGAKQTVNGDAAFAGYGVSFAPLRHDDYAGRSVTGKVAIFLGRTGPKGFTNAHNRILNSRARMATETQHAVASITQAATTPAAQPQTGPPAQRVDFQTAQRLDAPIAPQITATDDFFTFLFSASGVDYATLKARPRSRSRFPTSRSPASRSPSPLTRPTTSSRPASRATSSD